MTHLGHLCENLDSQMPSSETVMPGSEVGPGLSIPNNNKYPNDSYGKANVENTIQSLILIHCLFSYLALTMVFLRV